MRMMARPSRLAAMPGIERQFTSVWRAFPDFQVERTAGPYMARDALAFPYGAGSAKR